MDLDDFKTINDSLGHAAGDQVLRDIGERLLGNLRTADTAARLGGDEFAVLLEDGGEEGMTAADVAERILSMLDEPFLLDETEVFVRREHRHLGRGARRRAGERRGAPAERRRRDVPREGEGQEPLPAVRAGDARHRAEAPGAEGRAAARAGARRVPALLSAGDRARDRQGLGRRGADPLVPPGARDGAAARLHPARGGDRAHRADRPLGPEGGLPLRGRAPGALPAGGAAAHGREPVCAAGGADRAGRRGAADPRGHRARSLAR